jgi:uncharacterized protein (DUF433 family)
MSALPIGSDKIKVYYILEALRCGETLDQVVADLTEEDVAEVLGCR